ncbi:MAG: 16S rRNA (cytosine(1402)-N(4))-methyltransferase RsmH [Myxococcales bacterium]|jgi:16S rRNA (cytosine1402-N4)-methyltransferase|nr:16S rRNA (cytosine(1402)-N(4))-methyltransferase RsmH [Myxococcales bacterium]
MTMAALEPPTDFHHVTVMRDEAIAALAPRAGGLYLDVTAGGGGHTEAILQANAGARVIAFDRDPTAIQAATRRLSGFGDRVDVVRACFSEVEAELAARDITLVDGVIADLGVSSPQLDAAERGMSFRKEGPLDMRMDPTQGETALELIERVSQDELADIIYQLGEERRSRRVARCVKQAAEAGELSTTSDLRRAIVRATGPRRVGGIDPATRTFQALRLAVNRELDELAQLLEAAHRVLRPGGVAVFISFHSLEDRLVKRAFQNAELWERVTRKPLVASETEQNDNPRSRSAKLRAARRAVPGPTPEPTWEEFDRDLA